MLKTSVRLMLAAALTASAGLAGCTNPNGPVGADGKTPSPAPSSSTGLSADVSVKLPDPLDIASVTGLTAKSCSEESGLKSSNGAATTVNFKNSSSGKINIYWLDYNGKRVSYKQGLAAGASHQQSTFVTHPWVITNDQDQCMGIYTPSSAGTVTLDVKKTVTVSGSSGSSSATGSGSGSGSASGGVYTEAQVRSAIQCMKASGNSQAVSVATAWEFQLNTAASVGKGAEVAAALSTSLAATQKGFGLNCL